MTSEEPLPDRCGAECRNGGYCTQYPVEGSNRCRMHGGAANNAGANNGNYKHGAYSKYLQSDLTEAEREAYGDLVDAFEDPDQTLDAIRELAAEVLLKYKRSADERFLREFRQLADTFNLAPNADQVELDADVDTNGGLDEETEVALREALRSRRGEET